MANSKVTLESLCFELVRDYFVSNGIKKSVDSINNCDIYLKKNVSWTGRSIRDSSVNFVYLKNITFNKKFL